VFGSWDEMGWNHFILLLPVFQEPRDEGIPESRVIFLQDSSSREKVVPFAQRFSPFLSRPPSSLSDAAAEDAPARRAAALAAAIQATGADGATEIGRSNRRPKKWQATQSNGDGS
jgi:hypothetical protein